MVLLLVVVGPERLPTVAYQVGRVVRQMQRYARAVRDEFGDEIGYLEEQYKTVKGEVDSAQQSLRSQQQQLTRELNEATGPVPLSIVPAASPAVTPDPIRAFDPPAVSEAAPETPSAGPAQAPPLVF